MRSKLTELIFLVYGEAKVLATAEQRELAHKVRTIVMPLMDKLHKKEDVHRQDVEEALDIAREFRKSLEGDDNVQAKPYRP